MNSEGLKKLQTFFSTGINILAPLFAKLRLSGVLRMIVSDVEKASSSSLNFPLKLGVICLETPDVQANFTRPFKY